MQIPGTQNRMELDHLGGKGKEGVQKSVLWTTSSGESYAQESLRLVQIKRLVNKKVLFYKWLSLLSRKHSVFPKIQKMTF